MLGKITTFLVADEENEHFHAARGLIFKRKLNHIYGEGMAPCPSPQGFSSPPQGLPGLVFQQSRPGTSGRAAEER